MNDVTQLCRLAASALSQSAWPEAERLANAALGREPGHIEARRLQALARHHLGHGEAAAETLRAAIGQAPRNALLHMNLGSVLAALGQHGDALEALRRACELEPGRAAAWFNLGKALKAQAHEREALAALLNALRLHPDHAKALAELGDVYKALGDVEAAANAFRRSLAFRPDSGHAWWGLANLKVVPFTHMELTTMQRELARPEISTEDRIRIGFALSQALEQHEEYGAAFATLCQANAMQRARLPWDRKAFSAVVDRLLEMEWRESSRESAARGSEVIFIVGLPRSGTTLVEQILAAHSLVRGASELADMPTVIEAEGKRRGMRFPEWLPLASQEDWKRLGDEYLDRTQRWQDKGRRFTDKWPNNFLYVDAILHMLPGARVVGCDRNPMDTTWSCFQQYFAWGQAFSYDLDDLVAYYRDFRRLDQLWKSRFPKHYLGWRHEALIEAPATRIAELLAFLGLPNEPACLAPQQSRRAIRSASAAQVLEPIRGDRIERWRPFADLLHPWRAALAEAL